METCDDVREPIMLGRVVELLSPALTSPGAIYVDYTLGLGGHTRAVLEITPSARLIDVNRDPDALAVVREQFDPLAERATPVKVVYDELPKMLAGPDVGGVHTVFTDFGLSSLQIDRGEQGFAYRMDAPLGMCTNRGKGRSAADLLNSAPPAELMRIPRHYSEGRFAERIVAVVVEERETRPFGSSGRLVEVISNAIPTAAKHFPEHPAKRTFQTLRIAVNNKLVTLERFLPAAITALTFGGRLVMPSYHSLEGRPVKRHLVASTAGGVPRDMPVVPEHLKSRFKLLTRGTERPPEQEIRSNPRVASTKLRAATRIGEVQLNALVAEVEQSARESSRPCLRLVPLVKARVSTFGFLLILAILVALDMALVMVVTTRVGAQSRDLADLRKETTQLSYETVACCMELQGVLSSGSLALHAPKLGMVPNPFLAFVDPSTDTILG